MADTTIPLQPDFDRQATAKRAVAYYIETYGVPVSDRPVYTLFVVWFTSVLKNWKAMVSSTLPDGCYYEVTYNGDKNEIYVDVYKKVDNFVLSPNDGFFVQKAFFDNTQE